MTIFKKPWKLTDGFLFGGALALLGFIIQIVAGPVDWELIASPVNLILLAVFLAFVVAAFLLKDAPAFSVGWVPRQRPFPPSHGLLC